METQKTPNSQSNLEKEKWSWRNQASWLQTILESYSHQNRMVLSQKQIYRSMEQDRKLRNKPTHLWSITLSQRGQTIEWRTDILVNKWCWENNAKEWSETLILHHIQSLTQNDFKDLNVRPKTIKTPRIKHRAKASGYWIWQWFIG